AGRRAGVDDSVAVAGDAAFVLGDQSDELTWNPGVFLPDECGTADEVALCELDQPAKVGLEGRRGVVDVVAVKRHPHLEAQGIAGAKPARGDKIGRASCRERV